MLVFTKLILTSISNVSNDNPGRFWQDVCPLFNLFSHSAFSLSDLIKGQGICRINLPSCFFFPLLQWRSDFLKDRVRIPVNHEAQEECLGIAVLDMMRLAKESGRSPVSIFNDIRWDMLTQQKWGGHLNSPIMFR